VPQVTDSRNHPAALYRRRQAVRSAGPRISLAKATVLRNAPQVHVENIQLLLCVPFAYKQRILHVAHTLMMVALRTSETSVLTEPHGLTSQKMALSIVSLALM
jgi:hypothetical protein